MARRTTARSCASPSSPRAELTCLNVEEQPARRGAPPDEPIPLVIGNANHMEMFEDDAFDIVVSSAMLEHDPCFWSSVAEMRRVLRPGGLLFIGVPGFVPLTFDDGTSTRTYRFHGGRDFWRFSDMAVRHAVLRWLRRRTRRSDPRSATHRRPRPETEAPAARGDITLTSGDIRSHLT
ncbi:MAG: class I SAM-dependent methyltransferase [Ilumatobacteraceae bacterium]